MGSEMCIRDRLEAVAHVALSTFGNLVTHAGDVPKDGSQEEGRLLQAA